MASLNPEEWILRGAQNDNKCTPSFAVRSRGAALI